MTNRCSFTAQLNKLILIKNESLNSWSVFFSYSLSKKHTNSQYTIYIVLLLEGARVKLFELVDVDNDDK